MFLNGLHQSIDEFALLAVICDAGVGLEKAVRNFVELFATRDELLQLVGSTTVACIGPITADTAREAGLTVHVMAAQNTIPALAEAIIQHVDSRRARHPTSAASSSSGRV